MQIMVNATRQGNFNENLSMRAWASKLSSNSSRGKILRALSNWMRPFDTLTWMVKNQIKNFSRNIKAVPSNSAPEIYVTQKTEWHLLCCCHDNSLVSSLYLKKPNIPRPFATFLMGQRVFLGTYMVPKQSNGDDLDSWHGLHGPWIVLEKGSTPWKVLENWKLC